MSLLFLMQTTLAQDTQPIGDEPPFIFGGLAWSPDGDALVVGTSEGIWLHKAEDLAPIRQLTEQPYVTALDWSPDGKTIAAGDADGVIHLWNVETNERVFDLQGFTWVVTSVKWNSAGNLLASGSLDETIRIWDTANGEVLQLIEIARGATTDYSVTWSPDAEQIAAQGDEGISVWDVQTGELDLSLPYNYETPVVKWSPDGNTIAAGRFGGEVDLWDATTGEHVNTFIADNYSVEALAWNPASTLLASNGFFPSDEVGDGRLRIWDVRTGELIADVQGGLMSGDAYYTNALAWSPDGSRLASTSDDGKIYMWDTEAYEVVALYEGYSSILLSE